MLWPLLCSGGRRSSFALSFHLFPANWIGQDCLLRNAENKQLKGNFISVINLKSKVHYFFYLSHLKIITYHTWGVFFFFRKWELWEKVMVENPGVKEMRFPGNRKWEEESPMRRIPEGTNWHNLSPMSPIHSTKRDLELFDDWWCWFLVGHAWGKKLTRGLSGFLIW